MCALWYEEAGPEHRIHPVRVKSEIFWEQTDWGRSPWLGYLLFFLWLCAAIIGGSALLFFFLCLSGDLIHSCLLSLDSIKRKCLFRSTTWDKDLNPCHNPIHLRSSSFPTFADIFSWEDMLASLFWFGLVLFSSVYQKSFSKRFFCFFPLWWSKLPILLPPSFFFCWGILVAFKLHSYCTYCCFLGTTTAWHLVPLLFAKSLFRCTLTEHLVFLSQVCINPIFTDLKSEVPITVVVESQSS